MSDVRDAHRQARHPGRRGVPFAQPDPDERREQLRRYCVNLVRIEHCVGAQEEAYEKLGKAVPVSELAALQMTFCAMERDAIFRAPLEIVSFFREHAPRVAGAHGRKYPAELERLMFDRLGKLGLSLRYAR
jgi:hypothetical protein